MRWLSFIGQHFPINGINIYNFIFKFYWTLSWLIKNAYECTKISARTNLFKRMWNGHPLIHARGMINYKYEMTSTIHNATKHVNTRTVSISLLHYWLTEPAVYVSYLFHPSTFLQTIGILNSICLSNSLCLRFVLNWAHPINLLGCASE